MPGLHQLEEIHEASLAASRAANLHAQAAARIGLGGGRARSASAGIALEPLVTVGVGGAAAGVGLGALAGEFGVALGAPAVSAYFAAWGASLYGAWSRAERADALEVVTESVSAVVGAVCSVRFVGGRRPRLPRTVHVYYPASIGLEEANTPKMVADAVSHRSAGQYRIHRHDQRKCEIVLRLTGQAAAVEEEEKAPPREQVRAERTVRQLLGESARLVDVKLDENDALCSFSVEHEAGIRVGTEAQRARVERLVSVMLPGQWRASWDLEGERVAFEQRAPMPAQVLHPIPDLKGQSFTARMIPYGIDEEGETTCWSIVGSAGTPHGIVVGATGTGKTVDIRGIVMEWCARGWPVWISDPKRVEFNTLRDWPNVQIVATSVQEQIAIVHRAAELMDYRYRLVEAGKRRTSDFPPLLLVMDEYREFYGNVKAWYSTVKEKGGPSVPPCLERFSSIARLGRTGGIHAEVGVQRPDADFMTGEMRDNFRCRTSLGGLSPQGAIMMWEAAHIGVALPKIPGRGTTRRPDGRVVEMQAYWTPEPHRAAPGSEDEAWLEQMRALTPLKHERLVVVPPEEDWDDEAGDKPRYNAYADANLVPLSARPDLDPDLATRIDVSSMNPVLAALAGVNDLPDEDEPVQGRPRASATPNEDGDNGVYISYDHGHEPVVLSIEQAPTGPTPATGQRWLHPVPDADDHDDPSVLSEADPADEGTSWDASHDPAEDIPVGSLEVGDLVLIHEALGLWGIVRSVDDDIAADDEDYVVINYIDLDGVEDLASLGRREIVTARRIQPGADLDL